MVGKFEKEGLIVLDLLGYDAVATTLLGVPIKCSILREESILRSLATVKNLGHVGKVSPNGEVYKGLDLKAIVEVNRMAKC